MPRVISIRTVLLALLCAAAGCGTRVGEGSRPLPAAKVAERPRTAAPAGAATTQLPASDAIGTAHPGLLLAAAPDASWAAFCQARSDTDRDGRIALRAGAHGALLGDRARGYFVVGRGVGSKIDELLAYAPGGRFAAVRRGERLWLVDAGRGTQTELAGGVADLASDGVPFRHHRSVAFDPSGARLLYLRRASAESEVVVRDLASGREHTVRAGTGEVLRVEFARDASWLVLQAVAEDTDGNGRLEWPAPRVPLNATQCTSTNTRYPVWQPRGDVARTRVARVFGTQFEDAAGFVAVLGAGFVVREPSERLVWRPARDAGDDAADAGSAPPDTELAPAACAARVVFVDAAREALVIGCSAAGARWPLRLVARGYSAELGIDLAPTELLRPCETAPRLLALYPGQASVLLDLERRLLVTLQPGDLVLCTHGKTALVQRARELWTFDVESGARTFLTGDLAAQPDVLLNAPVVYVSPWVVDVSQSKLLGRFHDAGPPLAVARDGRLLTWASQGPSAADLPLGPLRWSAPRP